MYDRARCCGRKAGTAGERSIAELARCACGG